MTVSSEQLETAASICSSVGAAALAFRVSTSPRRKQECNPNRDPTCPADEPICDARAVLPPVECLECRNLSRNIPSVVMVSATGPAAVELAFEPRLEGIARRAVLRRRRLQRIHQVPTSREGPG
jgi:hypothetical protein